METTAPTSELSLRYLFKMFGWTFGIFWGISRFYTVTYIALNWIMSLQNLVNAYLIAGIIDALTAAAVNKTASFNDLIPWLALIFAYNAISALLEGIQRYATTYLRMNVNRSSSALLYRHIRLLGIQTVEQPDVTNKVQRATNNLGLLWNYFEVIIEITGFIVSAVTAGIALLQVMPLMLPVLIVIVIIRFLPERHYNKADYRLSYGNTENFRKNSLDTFNLRDPKQLLEVTINGAYDFFDQRYHKFNQWYLNQSLAIKLGRERSKYFGKMLEVVANVASYAIIFQNLLNGFSTVGRVTAEIRALNIFTSSMSSALSYFSSAYELALQMLDVYLLFQTQPEVADGNIELPRLSNPPGIEFANVSFHYPDSERLVFEDLDLQIKPGEKVAIVGHNGAGKTTLVKLIARIYAPQKGEINIDEHNLNELKIEDWYKNIGILFQEYNNYVHLNVRDSILLGRPRKPFDEERAIEALKMADAYEFVQEYKFGLDQILGEQFTNGIRPSTGQKQKLAIARFFYRNAPLVIFDEPTAAIDAVSEYKIFNRIYDFFVNKTVIIISHRFSTVRNADRIIVMDHGKIAEQGTHTELIERNGIYAEAFKLQAEGYN